MIHASMWSPPASSGRACSCGDRASPSAAPVTDDIVDDGVPVLVPVPVLPAAAAAGESSDHMAAAVDQPV